MLEWIWDNVAKVLGVLGFVLAVWNQIASWRERREKRVKEAPRGSLLVEYAPSIGTGDVTANFVNTRSNRLRITKAELIEPKGLGLIYSPRTWKEETSAPPKRTVMLKWVVFSSDESGGKLSGHLTLGPLDDGSFVPSTSQDREMISFKIRFSGDEMAANPRPITIVATTVIKA